MAEPKLIKRSVNSIEKMEKGYNINEIKQILALQFPELEREYRVETLKLFGSRLRGDNRPGSDLDILVSFSEPPSLLEFVRLKNRLQEILGLKVDLVMESALKPNIGKIILDEAVPV